MKIVADKNIPFIREYLPPDIVEFRDTKTITNEVLKDARVLLVRSVTRCDATLLDGTQIKLIVSATIGDDHIDKNYCRRHNIAWETASGCNKRAVVQYVLWSLYYLQAEYNLDWKSKTIGIIGAGNTGGLLSKALQSLGVKHLLNDPPRQEAENSSTLVSLDEIRQKADVISLHVPLTLTGKYATYHLLDDDFFAQGKKEICLINTSRGAVVSPAVLKKWKEKGVIRHLILDVWENEPEIDRQLLQMTTLGTPHIAGYSLRGKINASYMSLKHIEKHCDLHFSGIDAIFNNIEAGTLFHTYRKSENIYGILKQIWDIEQDSRKLKNHPHHFSDFRKNYTLRPQLQDIELRLENGETDIREEIEKLKKGI